ncbi:retrovirus-related pol polyprotein from transposon TNT 1-94 [Tanacetum coccineum]
MSGEDSVENVKKDIDEIETINIELEHGVAKLLSENENLINEREHLKSIYKNQFDSIRKTRVESKEHLLKNELRNLKGKNVVDTAVLKPSATIALEMFKLDIEPISHRLKNNRDAHEVYIEKTIENTVTLRGFEERARIQNPSEPLLESACMFTKHVQELFAEPVSNALVKHSVRNAKFEYICAICNKCLFDANHDMCIIDYMNDVNVRSKFKSKRNTMRKVWKPMGKVFSEIGYSWKHTGRNFTIIRNSRRPKATRSVGFSSKVKIVESKTSNSKEPKQSWGSTIFDVPSSSLNNRKLSKFVLCKKHSHKPKAEDSIQEKLYLLHMDLYGPMRIQSINGRKYILVIVDDYSRTDNGTEFVNHTLKAYYEEVRISHQTFVARTPQQNGIIKRQNCTLVEAARTMLIFSKAPLFLWAEAVATACYT